MFENLQFWWWSHPRFEYHRQILLSSLGIDTLRLLQVVYGNKGKELARIHEWSDPYRNYYNTNPLADTWQPVRQLLAAGFVTRDEVCVTNYQVTEKGLRFLKHYAKWTGEYELEKTLEKVNLYD